MLPIHIILGASDFTKIKTRTCPRVGQIGESFSEQTKMGWVTMAPGRENDIVSALFAKTSVNDYEKLCGTAVLGLKESHYRHDDYERQLKRDDECWYEKGLVWKEGNLPLGNNKNGSLGKLNSLVRNLK